MRLLLLILFSVACTALTGQTPDRVPDVIEEQFIEWFNSNQENTSEPIYDGVSYPLRRISRYGHPYFGSGQWTIGSIKYLDHWYLNVAMLFDITQDQLVVQVPNSNNNFGIEVNMENVNQFLIYESQFIAWGMDFFEILYVGKNFTLLGNHIKEVRLEPSGAQISGHSEYFLLSDMELYPLRNKKSLKVFSPNALDMAKELKSSESKLDVNNQDRLITFIQRFDAKLD